MFGFSQRPCLKMTLSLQCPICRMNMDSERQMDDMTAAVLVGAVKYSMCCHCLQEVGQKTMKNHWYRKRWDKKMDEMGLVWKGKGLLSA